MREVQAVLVVMGDSHLLQHAHREGETATV